MERMGRSDRKAWRERRETGGKRGNPETRENPVKMVKTEM